MHRATMNNKATRISIAIPHGPSVDTIVAPAPELLEKEGQALKYLAMNYREYIQLQQSEKNYMKSTFDHIRASAIYGAALSHFNRTSTILKQLQLPLCFFSYVFHMQSLLLYDLLIPWQFIV